MKKIVFYMVLQSGFHQWKIFDTEQEAMSWIDDMVDAAEGDEEVFKVTSIGDIEWTQTGEKWKPLKNGQLIQA